MAISYRVSPHQLDDTTNRKRHVAPFGPFPTSGCLSVRQLRRIIVDKLLSSITEEATEFEQNSGNGNCERILNCDQGTEIGTLPLTRIWHQLRL